MKNLKQWGMIKENPWNQLVIYTHTYTHSHKYTHIHHIQAHTSTYTHTHTHACCHPRMYIAKSIYTCIQHSTQRKQNFSLDVKKKDKPWLDVVTLLIYLNRHFFSLQVNNYKLTIQNIKVNSEISKSLMRCVVVIVLLLWMIIPMCYYSQMDYYCVFSLYLSVSFI